MFGWQAVTQNFQRSLELLDCFGETILLNKQLPQVISHYGCIRSTQPHRLSGHRQSLPVQSLSGFQPLLGVPIPSDVSEK
jgi:hypothetical protein